MPVWPFKRRRSGALKDKDPSTSRPLSEKPLPTAPPARGHTPSDLPPSTPKSRPVKSREAAEPVMDALSSPRTSAGKENAPLRRKDSAEDITALPGSRRLEHSPHLRPVDANARRAEIPYNFRDHSSSHVNISRHDSADGRSKSKLLRSISNRQEAGVGPLRRHSSRRPRNDPVREEEIRAMSATLPIPKRPGDGPLRRDSKKLRSLGARSSTVSLPPDGSVHSSMSNILAQRGWEVGFLDIFNPRPNVRISGVPQGVASTSVLPSPPSPIVEEPWVPEKKGKRPRTRGSTRKRQTIGQEADELDAAELRMLLDRDKKRSVKKRQEQQDRLDRKLRDEAMGSPRKDDVAEPVEKPPIPMRSPARSLRELRPLLDLGAPMPPTAIHPALRSQSSVGLGIDEDRRELPSPSQQLLNPFADPLLEEPERIDSLSAPEALTPSGFSPLATPFEEGDEPVFETARAVRLSLAHTPPLSPNVFGSLRAPSRSTAPSDLSESNSVTTERRTIDSRASRTGGWTSFFRRNTQRRAGDASPSAGSFSNTSRESMRHQPLPAHLVDPAPPYSSHRGSYSGAPVRTMSKFREDLPELPISPPESRTQSPDVTTIATRTDSAQALRAQNAARPLSPSALVGGTDTQSQSGGRLATRYDTPVSPEPGSRPEVSASLASVDSEGSWLASGSMKRRSNQSGLSRTYGSLSRRNPDFSASFEELGGDKDAEYVANTRTPSALPTPSEDDIVSGVAATTIATAHPVTVHTSVRHRPRVIERDAARVQSREGLLLENASPVDSTGDSSTDSHSKDLDEDSEYPGPSLQKATSVNFGKAHAKRVSAGSARMLDIMKPSSPTLGFRDSSMSPPPAEQTLVEDEKVHEERE